jgi:YYY domain-containing protein
MTATTQNRSALIYFLLALILLAGLVLRTWNVRWDAGMNTHPDERSTACFVAPTIGWPQSWAEFRDPQRSPLNPMWNQERQERRSFTYGHFPLYLGVLTAEVMYRLAPVADSLPVSPRTVEMMQNANRGCIAIPGRLMIALLDTLTILLLFFLGRRIYGAWAGILAAAFYAFAAQAVQLSHFFAMDPASTTFTVLAVLGGVQMAQDRSWRAVILTGVAAGLAISSKFSALPILAVPVLAAAIVLWQERNSETGGVDGRTALHMIVGVPVTLLLAVISFAVTSPYAILDWESFVQATLVEQGAMVRGVADFPFTRQYRNTTPYLYFIEQQVAWGLWWPLGILALVGTLWAAAKVFLLRARPGELIVWAWVIPYFGLTGAFLAKFNRYMSPVLPFVLLFAAGMIWTLYEARRRGSVDARRRRDEDFSAVTALPPPDPYTSPDPRTFASSLRRLVAILLAVIGIGGGLFWSLAYVNGVYNTPHPWETAARWMAENVEPGAVVLCEQWDDCMPWGVPDVPEVNAANSQIRRINWGPYEEDTPQKYEILRERLREADYVAYSSKRIYGSVTELPQRYPMTTRYYDYMFNGQLGFRVATHITTPPQLFGIEFPDHEADESWSLYDHPQVTIFQKERDLSDAEFAQLLGGAYEGAIAYYRGEDSPLDPLLNALGLGSRPESHGRGLVNRVIDLLRGEEHAPSAPPPPGERLDLMLDRPLNRLPVVDDYRWNTTASENPGLAVLWWWLVVALLGWLAWPLTFVIFRPLRDRGFLLSRAVGWLLAAWLLWIFASFGLAHNTVTNSWLAVGLLALLSGLALVWCWREIGALLRRMWGFLLLGEALFAAAYLLFVVIRMYNPDLWQPWFGGEKFMEFAFLNGILRSPTFPPVDPHFAGGFINYYYFGIYLVAFIIKLTGIYAEVAFNLAIPTLFALTVVNAFGVAYSAVVPFARRVTVAEAQTPLRRPLVDGVERESVEVIPRPSPEPLADGEFSDYRNWGRPLPGHRPSLSQAVSMAGSGSRAGTLEIDLDRGGSRVFAADGVAIHPSPGVQNRHPAAQTIAVEDETIPWQRGVGWALLAPLFVAILGNLEGFAQVVRRLAALSPTDFQSAMPGVETFVHAVSGFWQVMTTDARISGYDFWGPSRVIGETINEFPYWSFTFADLHPHMIGIPFSVLFLGLALTVLLTYGVDWRQAWRYGLLLLVAFGLLLGTLASINLWELPTYFGLGVLVLAVSLFRGQGRVDWLLLALFSVLYILAAYLFFWPFFSNYANVGASGVGLVRSPDNLGHWLLIWGFFIFVLAGWILYRATRPARPGDARPTGLERWLSLAWGRADRLPRLLHLQGLLVDRPTVAYLLGQLLVPFAIVIALVLAWRGWTVLALCLPFLAISFLLLWRRGRHADAGTLLGLLLTTTGFALLAGTQIFFLRDFLQGGDWYRMNTLFKFFIQVWVLWGVAAAIAVAQIIGERRRTTDDRRQTTDDKRRNTQYSILDTQHATRPTPWRTAWVIGFALLLVASLAYPVVGTPARLDQRFPGWRPEVRTLDGLEFMRQGTYFWPDSNNPIQLHYDWLTIQWVLDNLRGNMVILESSEIDYYRAGGTRIASMTGLSGLNGKHENEQRYGDVVGERNARFTELWRTPSIERTQELIGELNVDLIYISQLERFLHPEGVEKFHTMAAAGLLDLLYYNDQATLYVVPGRLIQAADGFYYPAR